MHLGPSDRKREDMGVGVGGSAAGGGPLFETEQAKRRVAYKLYAATVAAAVCLVVWYRAVNFPAEAGRGWWAGMMAAELWFGFYWVIIQSVRWNPCRRRTHKDRLSHRYGTELPCVDIFVCTADPVSEPPTLVVPTVLSVMAYDYPPEKLSIYLSDDGGSILTFYALWEASVFAKHWLPFCKRFNVEPRSPAAYFSKSCNSYNKSYLNEQSLMKTLYVEMVDRINSVIGQGKIPEEVVHNRGFSEWKSGMTSRDHPPIVQIIIDGKEKGLVDVEGNALPTLVYMAREKRPQHHHNFKAGAMNALIRVSSQISNSPIILNVDCDMYSNNSQSIRDALCFFLDEDKGNDIGYVQYPQYFVNCGKNDLYGNAFNVVNEVEIRGMDNWGGPLYAGTGCFHRRESLCGRKYSKDYKEDWKRGVQRKNEESANTLEQRTKTLATCTYEHDTLWGKEIGLKYGCAVEDVITGFAIQCRGWKSIYFNPARKGFLGMAPTSLAQSLMQHKRWSEGNFNIFLSKYCPFFHGHGKIKLGLQMGYSIYGLWAPNSIPTLYYLSIPSLCLLKGIPLFPRIYSQWFIPFAYVIISNIAYSLAESLRCGDTLRSWWNTQLMWILRRETAYLHGTIDTILTLLGFSKMTFSITAKVTDEDASKRYEQELMEFGSFSPMFTIISSIALLNLVCLLSVVKRLVLDEGIKALESLSLQVLLCGVVVALNLPVYKGLFLRSDKGSIPTSVTMNSLGFALLACLLIVK